MLRTAIMIDDEDVRMCKLLGEFYARKIAEREEPHAKCIENIELMDYGNFYRIAFDYE